MSIRIYTNILQNIILLKFQEVTKNNPGKSVILSAFSVLTPLAQLSLAATGESHDELLKAIGLPNDNVVSLITFS